MWQKVVPPRVLLWFVHLFRLPLFLTPFLLFLRPDAKEILNEREREREEKKTSEKTRNEIKRECTALCAAIHLYSHGCRVEFKFMPRAQALRSHSFRIKKNFTRGYHTHLDSLCLIVFFLPFVIGTVLRLFIMQIFYHYSTEQRGNKKKNKKKY